MHIHIHIYPIAVADSATVPCPGDAASGPEGQGSRGHTEVKPACVHTEVKPACVHTEVKPMHKMRHWCRKRGMGVKTEVKPMQIH